MTWDDSVNDDEDFTELNQDVTTIKFSACDDSKGVNGGILRIRHPFTIGAWNSHKESSQ